MNRNHAFAVFLCSLAAVILISASIGTETWTVNTFGLLGATGENVTCRGTRTLGLFNGVDNYHTSGDNCFREEVIAIDVLTEDTLSFNRSLLFAVISFLAVALFFLVTVVAVSSYNLCARPYETYAGPIGLLVYLSTVVGAVIIAMILYIVIGLTEVNTSNPQPAAYETLRSDFGFSFYIFIASYLPLFLAILAVVLSEKNFTKNMKTKVFHSSQTAYPEETTKDEIFMF